MMFILGSLDKRVVDFLVVLIELFFARCYGLGATSEHRFKIGNSLQRGPVDPKFQVEWVAHTNRSCSQKTRLNDLSYGIKNLDRSFFRFVTMHAFDRQTDRERDRQTDGRTDGQLSSH